MLSVARSANTFLWKCLLPATSLWLVYTEKLIFRNNDADTDVRIRNTEKYRMPTINNQKYWKLVRYSPQETEVRTYVDT